MRALLSADAGLLVLFSPRCHHYAADNCSVELDFSIMYKFNIAKYVSFDVDLHSVITL